MEFFNNISRERFTAIAENYINDILEDRGNNNVEDLASAFSNAGFTKSEFFQILDKYYLNDFNWTEETAPAEKVNTETGEGVFWKEYTEDEDINVGDSDQAILETALTQIGIPYTYEKSARDGTEYGWIDLKIVDEGEPTENTAAEIYFTKEGKFSGLY